MTRAAAWEQGWLRRARRIDSPNFGPRPAATAIDLLLVHSISLPPGEYGGDAIERLFTNRLDWDAHPYFGTIRGLTVSSSISFFATLSERLAEPLRRVA